MTGPSRKRARRGLPHIANARNGAVRLAERVLEGRLAADLAAPRPSKAVGRSCPHAPCASNVEVAELGDVPAVHEVRAAAGAEAPMLVDEAPAVAALVLYGTYIINSFIVRPRGSEKATIRIASKALPRGCSIRDGCKRLLGPLTETFLPNSKQAAFSYIFAKGFESLHMS